MRGKDSEGETEGEDEWDTGMKVCGERSGRYVGQTRGMHDEGSE